MTEFKKKVLVVGGDYAVEEIFSRRNWVVTTNVNTSPDELDLVVFTGGADIDPMSYNRPNEGSIHTNPKRDAFELWAYEKFKDVPKAGICRGGQLLNVLNGGEMLQDIPKARYGIKASRDVKTNLETMFEFCHHQGILPSDEAIVFTKADGNDFVDSCFYPKDKAYCFQGHPEWGHRNTRETFFREMNDCLRFNDA